MAVQTGKDTSIYLVTQGTCTVSSDVITLTLGTCTKIGYLSSYTLNSNRAELDNGAFGDLIKKSIHGIYSGTFSASGQYDPEENSQDAIRSAQEAGTSTVLIRLKKTGETKTFRVLPISFSDSGTVAGINAFSFETALQSIPKTS
jgi:hypothetical protein